MKTARRLWTVKADDLEDALRSSGIGLSGEEIRNMLFGDDYANDCLKELSFDEDASPEWDNNYEIRNKIYAFLRLHFPGEKSILVDVTW